jgi:acetylornithine deacetylase/succinyl-diaminopimelate desuccinylase-like protein
MIEQQISHAFQNWTSWLEDLTTFISFPSVSGEKQNPQGLTNAANWLEARLRQMNFQAVQQLPTGGNPVVYGEDLRAGDGAPTVLIYGHYDVVPAEDDGTWETDPFSAVIRDEFLFGRGASDMKGQIIACLAALDALRFTGPPTIRIKLLLEGEEEHPPRHLESFLGIHQELLKCDVCLNTDAGMAAPGMPTVVYSLRGNMLCELTIEGPSKELHTGLFGGVVHNPVHVISELVASLHDSKGRVAIPGFYVTVRPLEMEERQLLAQIPLEDRFFQEQSGVPQLWGDEDYSVHERIGARPAINVVRIITGRNRNVIPTTAQAGITLRLVNDQQPEEIFTRLKAHIAERAPATTTWDLVLKSGYGPAFTERNSPAVQAYSQAVEQVWDKPPIYSREGGGIPAVVWIQKILGVDSLLTGFGTPEDQQHGPNERIHLPTLQRGVETLIHFFHEMGKAGQRVDSH